MAQVRIWAIRAFLGLFLLAVAVPSWGQAQAPAVPVVLIHGLLGSPETTWASFAAWFEREGYVQGTTLFALDLSSSALEDDELSVLADAAGAADQIRRILAKTGAARVDLVGKSRGGLVVRLLASGDTASVVRRAVTIGTPHSGILPESQLRQMLAYAGIEPSLFTSLPRDLLPDSAVIRTMWAREERFADRRVPALAVVTTFRDGMPPAIAGHDGTTGPHALHDGFVPAKSQANWPGARVASFKIGPTPSQVQRLMSSGAGIFDLAGAIPHVIDTDQRAVFFAVRDFLSAADLPVPDRPCSPGCMDFTQLEGHWSGETVRSMLPGLLPYELDPQGNRRFDPDRPMTRAEYVYALARAAGLGERLDVTSFADVRGHWSLGYVQAAVNSGYVAGIAPGRFGPDEPLTRAQAATLVARARQFAPAPAPSRFPDTRGHWAESMVEAAAQQGILAGMPDGTFRPDESLTMAQAALILYRAFPPGR